MKLFIILSLTAFASSVLSLPESRIVGGDEALPGAWPWQIALFRDGSFNCGASILGPTWGVTAAHCVTADVTSYTIKVGTNIMDENCDSGKCVERPLKKHVSHPFYPINNSDIAFISWEEPIPEVSGKMHVKFVPMADERDQVGRKCYITGWGRISGGGFLPNELRQARIEVMEQESCLRHWPNIGDPHICIYDPIYDERGACNGDSGGPMVCEYGKDNWVLAGVTSYGSRGCFTAIPTVYARVSTFKQWLLGQASSQ